MMCSASQELLMLSTFHFCRDNHPASEVDNIPNRAGGLQREQVFLPGGAL